MARPFDMTQLPALTYAGVDGRRPASRVGVASLVMAGICVAWLMPTYLCSRGILISGPLAHQRGGPIGEALTDTVFWPIGITFALGILGTFQPRRRLRWLGAAAIGIVCVAFVALSPGPWR